MAIREQITVDVATVEVNDEYRVELTQLRKVQDYSPQQAIDLAAELHAAAERVIAMIDEDMDARLERMTAATPRTVTGEVVL